MFAGHALFAFAIAALVANWRGWDERDALVVGLVAGAFAAVPDVDVAYAVSGLVHWSTVDGSHSATTAFWDASRATHRSVTHSLVIGAIAAPTFALLARSGGHERHRLAVSGSLGLSVGLVVLTLVTAGPLMSVVLGLFLAAGGLVAVLAGRRTTLSATGVGLAALWGLWSHPWGDLFTGEPPALAFPFDATLVASRIMLNSDPTLHLLAAFAIELATVWLALFTVYRLTDRPVFPAIDRRAVVGALYGVSVLVATPPTLDVSYHFVFSILGVGILCGMIRTVPTSPFRALRSRSWSVGRPVSWRRATDTDRLATLRRRRSVNRIVDTARPSTDAVLGAALTATAGITVALATYTVSYLFVS